MLTFAVAAGPVIPERIIRGLRDPTPAGLPFRPTEHVVWVNPAGTVAFAGWQDDVDLGMGSRWTTSEEGVTAFTGNVWPRTGMWPAEGAWATQLRDHLRGRPLDRWTEDLLGIFTAVSLDADGVGTIASDALSISLVYRATTGGATVLSSNVRLAAHLAHAGTPPRDVLGAGWLAFAGYPIGHRTGFEGVDVVPYGVHVDVGPAGVCLRSVDRLPWRTPPAGDRLAVLDEVYAGMVASVRAALRYPVGRREVELTGGKDSRLILGLLLAEGIADQFDFRTFGADTLPDVVIARQLAATFDLRHERGLDRARWRWAKCRQEHLADAYPGVSDRELQLRANVGAWAGMRNAWQLETAAAPRGDRVTLCGLFGEALSTNYATSTRLRNHAQLRQTLLVDMQFGSASVLRPEVAASYREEFVGFAYESFSVEDAPQDLIDGLFLRHRMPRWFGLTQEADEAAHLYPLHSPLGVRLAFSLGARDRHAYWVYQRLYERARPALAKMPFSGAGWPEAFVPDRLPEPRTLPALRPVPNMVQQPRARLASTDLRRSFEAEDVATMRRYLVEDPSNPVFEILDRAAVADAVERFDVLREAQRMQLYGALTAAIWLGGHEILITA